jgi:hypothetical protein
MSDKIQALRASLAELDALNQYHQILRRCLEKTLTEEYTADLRLGLKNLHKPLAIEEEIVDERGNVLDFSEFPSAFKTAPWRIFPGAKIKTQPSYEEEMELVLNAEFLLPFLHFLYKRIDNRINTLKSKLDGKQNGI